MISGCGTATDQRCAEKREIPALGRIEALGWHEATHNPHGTAGAASGHARLRYAGGSRRSGEAVEFGDPELARVVNRQPFARDLAERG
jgi:hypothetical protein